jgi:hypothetical protein
MQPIPKEVAAWIAGFFDGEGTIGVYLTTGAKTPKPRVYLYNNHLSALTLVRQHLGGHLTKVAEDGGVSSFCLQLRLDELPRFVEYIVPHLRIKAANGMLLRRFLECRKEGWTEETISEVIGMYQAIKAPKALR